MNGLKRYFNRDAAQTARKASLAAAGLNIAEILILTPLIFPLALRARGADPVGAHANCGRAGLCADADQ